MRGAGDLAIAKIDKFAADQETKPCPPTALPQRSTYFPIFFTRDASTYGQQHDVNTIYACGHRREDVTTVFRR